jgi:hypothetical protein
MSAIKRSARPDYNPHSEPSGQPARPDQQRRRQRAEHCARAHGSRECADTRLAGSEQVDGNHDGEDGPCPAGKALSHGEADEQCQVVVPDDRPYTLDGLGHQMLPRG